jgi:hypothetical protein
LLFMDFAFEVIPNVADGFTLFILSDNAIYASI